MLESNRTKSKSAATAEGYAISDLADEFQVSTRTVRFYEEKGLLAPERGPGGQRVFRRRDRVRLKLILRGKRFGLTLDEIVAVLGKDNAKLSEKVQIQKAVTFGQQYLRKVRAQMEELRQIEKEMTEHGENCIARLTELGVSSPEIARLVKEASQ